MTANHAHTSTTRGVRNAYIRVWNGQIQGANAETVAAEFDRWYQAEIAAAEQRGAERGWDEAMTKQIQRLITDDPDAERFQMPANPYRADRIADRLEGDDGDV